MIVQGVHPSGWAPFGVSRVETHATMGVAPRSLSISPPPPPLRLSHRLSASTASTSSSAREGFLSNQHQMEGVFDEIRIFPSLAAERPTKSIAVANARCGAADEIDCRRERDLRSGRRNRAPSRERDLQQTHPGLICGAHPRASASQSPPFPPSARRCRRSRTSTHRNPIG